jgi:hypothetical protein
MAHLVDAEHGPIHFAQAVVLEARDIGMCDHGMDARKSLAALVSMRRMRMGVGAAENRCA